MRKIDFSQSGASDQKLTELPGYCVKPVTGRASLLRRLHGLIIPGWNSLARPLTRGQGRPFAEARGGVGSSAVWSLGSPRMRAALWPIARASRGRIADGLRRWDKRRAPKRPPAGQNRDGQPPEALFPA